MPDREPASLRIWAWLAAAGAISTAVLYAVIAGGQWAEQRGWAFPDVAGALYAWTGADGLMIAGLIILGNAILFLIWLYLLLAHLHSANPATPSHRPWVAVLWCAIPLVNLITSFFIMRGAWRATLHRGDTAPPLITLWALAAIVYSLLPLVPPLLSWQLDAVDADYELAANIGGALTFLLQAALILRLTRAQRGVAPVADIFA
jgi:hypothetical protein